MMKKIYCKPGINFVDMESLIIMDDSPKIQFNDDGSGTGTIVTSDDNADQDGPVYGKSVWDDDF